MWLKPDENLTQIDGSDDLYNLPLIKGEAWHIQDAGSNDDQRTEITLIPFFLQNNRASNTDFIVWIPESEKVTRLNLKRIKEKLNNKC